MAILFSSKVPAYLVDSENVGSTWLNLIQNQEKIDLYIFVTENAKSLNFSLLKELTGDHPYRITIIECEPGKNSLDFYLSSYLGYMIGKGKNSSYVVVSQDTGYDHVIEYWKRLGHDVERINTKPETVRKTRTTSRKTAAKKEEPKKNSETRIIVKKEESKQTAARQKGNEKKETKQKKKSSGSNRKQFLKNIMKDYPDNEVQGLADFLDSIPADKHGDLNHIYRSLIRKYKSEKGLAIYKLIKKELDRYYHQ